MRLQIKSHRAWLDAVGKESRQRGQCYVFAAQQPIVQPQIDAAQSRLAQLEQPDPLIEHLHHADSPRALWETLSLAQQRHIIQTLVLPRLQPVSATERGHRGLNLDRVDLQWRDQR